MNRRGFPILHTMVVAWAMVAPGLQPAHAQMAISQSPALVAPPPPTNLVLTIDDSGSMANAFVPDKAGDAANNSFVAYTSSDYNRLYYNPGISYAIPPNAAGLQASYPGAPTAFNAAYLDGFNPASGYVDLSTAYAATLTYAPGSSTQVFVAPAATVGTSAYYYTYIGGGSCTPPIPWQAPPPDSCFTQTIVSATSPAGAGAQAAGWSEAQNFANWYSFYRTRHLAIASAAAISMSDPGLLGTRVAWQGLTTCNDFTSGSCKGWQTSAASVDNRLHTFADSATSTHRTDFYSWLFRVPTNQTTPTRVAWWRAGEYFRQSVASSGQNSPYLLDPNNNGTSRAELACVNNFQITMTDGQWNTFQEGTFTGFCGGSPCHNNDAASTTFPDGQSYAPSLSAPASTSIYGDSNQDGLAEIAFYYWSTNLRPDLTATYSASAPPIKQYIADAATVNPLTNSNDSSWPYWNPRNDPATWPHMVNFTIGVGLTGSLTLNGLNWYQDSFGALPAGATALNANGYSNLLSVANACAGATGDPAAPRCNWPVTDNGGNGAGNVYDLWHGAINSRGQAFNADSPDQLVAALKTIIKRIEGQATGNSTAAGSSAALATSTTLYLGSYAAADWHGTVAAYAISGPGTANPGAVASTPTWTTDSSGSIPAGASRTIFVATASAPVPGSGLTVNPGAVSFDTIALPSTPLWSYLPTTTAGTDAANVVNYLRGDATDEAPNGLKYRPRTVSKLGDIVDSNPAYTNAENFGYQVLETTGNPEAAVSYYSYITGTKATRPAMVYVGANDGMLHAFDATAGNTSTVERFAYVPHSVVPNLPLLANPNYAHRFYVDTTPYVGDAFFGGAWHTVVVGATGAGGKGVFALDVTSPTSFGASSVLWDMDGTGIVSGTTNYGNGDPDLGYTLGSPTVLRLNDGKWYAAFGNGYLSSSGCPVLYLVRVDNGSQAMKINANGTTPCTVANGLGAPTALDIDGNGTTDFLYAGDLQGNLWKFDLRSTNSATWTVYKPSGATATLPMFKASTGGTTPVSQSIVGAPNLGSAPGGVMVYFGTGHFFAAGDTADTSQQSVYGVQDSGAVNLTRANLVQQNASPASDGSGNLTVSQTAVNLLSGNNGWVVDLPGAGERLQQQPFLVGNVVVFVSDIPNGNVCNGGCNSFLYGLSALTGGGGMDFFSSNGTYYDAIKSGVGCLSGLTVIVESGTSVLTYGFGPNFTGTSGSAAGGGGSGGGGGGGSTQQPTGNSPPQQPPCPPNVDCNRNNLNNVAGRVSWHEMVQ